MFLYSDSSYYSGGSQLYSPYYVPSSSFAPSFSGYGRNALYGTYSVPPDWSTFAAINRHYKPVLTPISETYAARRPQNLASLTRINSPKLNLHSSYVPPRPIQINTADIDVSSSRYRRPAAKSKSKSKSPFMPRVDQNDPPQNRSTIKRDRNIVRLSKHPKYVNFQSSRKPLSFLVGFTESGPKNKFKLFSQNSRGAESSKKTLSNSS